LKTLSPGIAIGVIYQVDTEIRNVMPVLVHNTDKEIERFEKAINIVAESIRLSKSNLMDKGYRDEAAIFDAHLMILFDSETISEIKITIKKEKKCAEYIYKEKMRSLVEQFRSLPDEYMSQRANDVADVAKQVVSTLLERSKRSSRHMAGDNVVLAAREVSPSMLSRWGESQLKGIITEVGGVYSHIAILAKAMNLPCIAGFKLPGTDMTGTSVILDANAQQVIINPTKKQVVEYNGKIESWRAALAEDTSDSQGSAVTMDGTAIEILANAGNITTAQAAVKNGAAGIGLLRTEFLFVDKFRPPSQDEQIAVLKTIFELFPNNPVTVRTFDIGGDKHPEWLHIPEEANPFLGVRGIRLSIKKKELFKLHLRAILCAAYRYNVKIMLPMVSVAQEVAFAKEFLYDIHSELVSQNINHLWPISLGIMIETPAAALMADKLAKMADFFSIGTNDLGQYVMCAERGGSFDYNLSEPTQPALIKAIELAIAAAKTNGIDLSVCGEMAGQEETAKILVELGVRCLSMNTMSIGKIKRMIRTLNLS
jgi:phosphoenolpyruvate-protein phosphotransferase